tara:strand:- start:7037 stop:7282 length:246 start_codon:yes stop_codon:yes gene_type:complete
MINIYVCNIEEKNKIKQITIKENTTIFTLLNEILFITDDINVGVYGKLVDKSYTLRENDRVEFYEKILIDPKVQRKNRVMK